MLIIVAALAVLSFLFIGIAALQYQHDATAAALPDPGNATQAWDAFNVTTRVGAEPTAAIGEGLPILFLLAFLAGILLMLLVVGR
jgi:hypothetical protein